MTGCSMIADLEKLRAERVDLLVGLEIDVEKPLGKTEGHASAA